MKKIKTSEDKKERSKQYYLKNKELYKAKYEQNKKKTKEYYINNRDKIRAYYRSWYLLNKEKLGIKMKERYEQKNKRKVKKNIEIKPETVMRFD